MKENSFYEERSDIDARKVKRVKKKNKVIKRKSKMKIVLQMSTILIIFAIILVSVYVGVIHFSKSTRLVNQLEQGNTLLDNGDYEAAIEKYKEALEYDTESVEIKSHIAHVYALIAQSKGSTDEAIEIYQMALAYDIGNVASYWGVANIFEERGDEANMLSALNTGYANTEDETIKAKLDAIQAEKDRIQAEADALAAQQAAEEAERVAKEEANNALLVPLAELFAKDDIDGVKDLIRTEEYVAMSEEIIGDDDLYYYGEKDDSGNYNGIGVGVYKNGYYYYGDYANNVRSGKGIWMRAIYSASSSIGSYIYEGEWGDGKPNGKGTATSNFFKDKIDATGLAKQVITGNYNNGLEEGKMSMVGTSKAGATYKYSYETSAGVAKKINNKDTGVKGQYYIAAGGDDVPMLMSDDSPRGVEGFVE